MSKPSLVHYTTGLVAGFGAEKAWYPGAKSILLKGFGLGRSIYTFSEELTEYNIRLDYLDITAFATTVLDSLGPNKTRFRWIAEGLPLPDDYMVVLREDFNECFDGLIVAIANQLVKDD
ncbi:hypothetical protein BDV39DRAFT_196653 [Aspergillus sergii]|uniref:Uncharacterized protein n=1 Tax=Aspergillus sergii TaxID=1034303 RepID=A0A5N6WP20_9EURO|nr:hypothetical protein BDV39DRAFT_196653 [Aspergillus sergii]